MVASRAASSYSGQVSAQTKVPSVAGDASTINDESAIKSVVSPTWAYVRTNSAGAMDHHSTGRTTAEANQELFIFNKGDDGNWRIARYSFSPTNLPDK